MNELIKRLSEPSTYAGLAGIAVILGIEPETYTQWGLAAAGLCGFIVTVFMAEKGGAE